MKRLALGAAAAAGTAIVLHRLAPKVRQMHAHCREMMRTRCRGTTAITWREREALAGPLPHLTQQRKSPAVAGPLQ